MATLPAASLIDSGFARVQRNHERFLPGLPNLPGQFLQLFRVPRGQRHSRPGCR